MNIAQDCRYSKTHEWVRVLPDGNVQIGITDYAQSSLGDITFVQLPKVGASLKAGEAFGVVESVKAASDLYAPISGDVLEVNSELDAAPQKINESAFDAGWMMKVKPAGALPALLSAEEYRAHVG